MSAPPSTPLASITIPTKTLRSGHKIPVFGLGVYLSAPGAETYDAVLNALKMGYRQVDTAQYYANEADVGRAIVDSGVPRSEVFVTSKHYTVDAWDYDTVLSSIKTTVANIGGGYVDLFLLHSPGSPVGRADAWRALEDAQKQGLVRDIGVSNYGIAHLNKLAETWRVKPAVNQFEVHPWLTRPELVAFCDKEGIVIQAYCPLARMQRASDAVLVKIAEEVKATPAQVMLAWSMARGFVAIPKTVSAARLEQNLASCAVKLTKDQVAALDALDEYLVIAVWDPSKTDAV